MNKKIYMPSDLKNIKQVVGEIAALLKARHIDEPDIFDIRLCMEEALINAVKYGNKFDKALEIEVDFSIADDKISISVEDKGTGFDHSRLPDPTEEENLLTGSGRGVFLIRHLMNELRFNKKGNRLTMVKYFNGRKEAKNTT